MKLHILISTIFLLVIGSTCFAQNKIVSVNKSTGTATVSIPLYTVQSGSLSLPISLDYNAVGVKVTDLESSAGIGWNLNAGGAITRVLRGLPDDITQDALGHKKLGWMNNSAAASITPTMIQNDGNPASCSDEVGDINNINTLFAPSSIDTQPDFFYVSAPGLSCKLVFDQKAQIFRPIPYQDLKISYVMAANVGGITSFSITNDKGITYTFGAAEPAFKQVAEGQYYGNSPPSFFTTLYNEYLTTGAYNATTQSFPGGINFTGSWDLTSMQDAYGNNITIQYTTGSKSNYNIPVNVYIYEYGTITTQYVAIGSTTRNWISQISYGNTTAVGGMKTAFLFSWQNSINSSQGCIINSITGFNRTFQFNYNDVISADGTNYTRYFLNNVTDQNCSSPFNYAFTYNNPAGLPNTNSNAIDYWGYYNGQTANTSLQPQVLINTSNTAYSTYYNPNTVVTPIGNPAITSPIETTGNNRQPAAYSSTMAFPLSATGTLSQIYYGNGGYTALAYQPNDYHDNMLGGVVLGGGIRIASITDGQLMQANPGDPQTNATKYYTYTDPATGYSSGNPISQPVFAFLTSDNSDESENWTYSTITSPTDLSTEDHTIIYGVVTETKAGLGRTENHFSVPATYSSSPITNTNLPWAPTICYVGRSPDVNNSGCPSVGLLTNSVNTFPFAPNPNYDFMRGLPIRTINYNDAGNEVSETDYTYTTPTPSIIYGFKSDGNGQLQENTGTAGSPNYSVTFPLYGYSVYPIYTSTQPLISTIQKTAYDLGSTTTTSSKQTTTNVLYNSSFHQLPTTISTTNSDGSTETTNITYSKDYITFSEDNDPNDSYTAALQRFQSQNINIPIETYHQFTPSGSRTPLVTSGQLIRMGIFPLTNGTGSFGFPAQKLSFSSQNGISNFVPSSISNNYTFINDPNYVVTENDLAYDNYGVLLSKDNGFKHIVTTITNHNNSLLEATIDNANYNEIAFSDFDNFNPNTNFTINTSSSTVAEGISSVPGHVGTATAGIAPGVTFTKLLNKSALTNYGIFSIWIQSSVSTGQINVTASGPGTVGTVTNAVSITYGNTTIPNTTTGWKYYEVKVPLTGITSTFTLTIASTASIAVDDILFYPDVAEVTTNGYDPVTNFITAKTNTNGVSTYYKVDTYGRTNYVYDQDKNITSRITYASSNNVQNLIGSSPNTVFNQIMPDFSYTINGNYAVTFSNTTFGTSCIPGQTFNWNFGDNTAGTTSVGTGSVTHAYSTFGTYDVTLSIPGTNATVTSPVSVNTLTTQITCKLSTDPEGWILTASNPQFATAWQSGYYIIWNIDPTGPYAAGSNNFSTDAEYDSKYITSNPSTSISFGNDGTILFGLGAGTTHIITATLVSSYTLPTTGPTGVLGQTGVTRDGSYVQVGTPVSVTVTIP